MPKQLVFNDDARTHLKRGMDKLAQAVATTLGPKGRNVALGKPWGAPTITHDGVTVAQEIELADAFENMGAQLLKEAATRTNDIAGDGTTTATVLAHAMVMQGLKVVATPAVAAGLTDHPWSVEEWLMFKLPLSPFVPPKRRGRPPKLALAAVTP